MILESIFDFHSKKNMVNRTQLCNLEIWNKEILSLSKSSGVITEDILLLKDKRCNNSSIKWGRYPYVAIYCFEKIVDIPRNPFIFSQDASPSKIPDWDFNWSTYHEICTRCGSWNYKCAWSTDKFVRKMMLLRKSESSLQKASSSTEGFF